ncbi:MAG: ATP pyrophosphatase [bacterium]
MAKTKAFCCWSGGKDSLLACVRASKEVEVTYLLNMVDENGISSRSHGLGSNVLKLQAEIIGIPLVQKKTSRQTYEQRFKEAIAEIKDLGVSPENRDSGLGVRDSGRLVAAGFSLISPEPSNHQTHFHLPLCPLPVGMSVSQGVFGDIDVVEHRDWIERVCREMEITPIFPLWEADREEMLAEFMQAGFRAVVVSSKIGQEWLGREIDEQFVNELRALGNIDLCGENGEYHSFVYDGPIFKKPVLFTPGKTTFKDNRWFLEIIPK